MQSDDFAESPASESGSDEGDEGGETDPDVTADDTSDDTRADTTFTMARLQKAAKVNPGLCLALSGSAEGGAGDGGQPVKEVWVAFVKSATNGIYARLEGVYLRAVDGGEGEWEMTDDTFMVVKDEKKVLKHFRTKHPLTVRTVIGIVEWEDCDGRVEVGWGEDKGLKMPESVWNSFREIVLTQEYED